MNKLLALFLTAALGLCLVCCAPAEDSRPGGYEKITPEEARAQMEHADPVILDVRTEEEFAEGHIQGALLLPDYELEARAAELLPDKSALILVYCRSGRRSALAAKQLVSMGYEQVKDFGGIIDWPYEIVQD